MQTTVKILVVSFLLFANYTSIIGGNGLLSFSPAPPTAMLEAVPDTVETNINESITFNVLENDTGEGIFVNSTFQPSHGSLSWKTNGDFTYTPDENYVGPDIIIYQIVDESGNQDGANVFITAKGTVGVPLQIQVLQECEAPSIYHVTAQVFGGTPPYLVDFLYGNNFLQFNQLTHIAEEYEFLSWSDLPTDEGYAIIVRDAEDNVVAENHLLELFCHEDVVNTCILETDFNLTPILTCDNGEKNIEIVPSGGSGNYTFYGAPLTSNGDYIVVEDSEGCQNILFYDELPSYTCPKAHDDVVNGAFNAPFNLKPLLNDEGEGLYISHIGGLSNGTIQWRPDDFLAYFPDEDFTGIDTIKYEITDIAGNTSRAKILAVVPENDEVEIFWERDCSRTEEEGQYEILFTVAGGKPPYEVTGTLDFFSEQILHLTDYRGDELLKLVIEDGVSFTITATDKEGENATVEPNLSACTIIDLNPNNYIFYISCVEEENYGILTAIDEYGMVSGSHANGDSLSNGENYSLQFPSNFNFEGIVYCPPIANNDLYYNHPSYLQFPLTFNPLLNDNGHGMRLVEVEQPKYGTLEEWQADGTVSYRPNPDFLGVVTFDYTSEDIGGNRTQATIKIVLAKPTELQITYERDCSEVIQNGAENYTVNAFVSGGVPPYQVQVNEGEFFELTENGEAFSFEVLNGEGFAIYAEDAGVVTHEAMVEELELAACSELVVLVERDCSFVCETGFYILNMFIDGGTPPYVISGSIDDTLETSGILSTNVENGVPYEITVVDADGNQFSEIGGEIGCTASCCEEIEIQIESLDDLFECSCNGGVIFTFDNILNSDTISYISGYWMNDISGDELQNGDTIPANAMIELYGISSENDDNCYIILYENEFISINTSNFCTPETYTLEAQDDFASTYPGEAVATNILQNDTGTSLQVVGVLVLPNCGTIMSLDPETGELVYVADPSSTCNSDSFIYEVIDECGNTTTAEVIIAFISDGPSDLIVEVERDCSNYFELGKYQLNVVVNGGTPPYTISGSINTVLEESGIVSTQINDGTPYEIKVVDSPGNEFFEQGGEVACTGQFFCSPYEITNVEEITNCTCDGSLIFSLDKIEFEKTVEKVWGFWVNENQEEIPLSLDQDTIPSNVYFEINGVRGEDWCQRFYYNGESGINGLTSDFCAPETYILEAQDDFASTNPGEAITINILQNDTGTNLQINAITVPPSCGEILDANPETGEIIYLPDFNTICAFDSFVCEVIDECGNTAEATVTIALPPDEPALFIEIERDCTDAENTGVYTIHVDIIAGIPPFTVSGSLNETIESLGEFSILIEDGFPYEILIIDAEGDEFYEIGGETSCCEQAIGEVILNESQSQTITCGEENIVLSIEGSEFNTYNWYLDEAATIPANPPTGQNWVNDEKVGERTVYLVATYGSLCASDTIPFTAYAYAPIAITPTYDCLIDSETQDSIAILTYEITGGDGNYTSNGNPQNDTLQNGDIYNIEIIDGNGCYASLSDTIDCDFLPISNTEYPISNIKLYPNPSNGNFTLSLQLEQEENIDVQVLDILGRVKLWQRFSTLPTVERHQFNLPSGLYFLQVSGENWRWTEKVIVR